MNVSSIVDVTTFGLSENSRRTITLESNALTRATRLEERKRKM